MRALILILVLITVDTAWAKKVIYRKSQEVSFESADIDGVARSPDGAYVHQKRGVKFLPLYKIKNAYDREVKSSVDYLR